MEWSPGASFPHFSALRNGVAPQREKPPSKLPSQQQESGVLPDNGENGESAAKTPRAAKPAALFYSTYSSTNAWTSFAKMRKSS